MSKKRQSNPAAQTAADGGVEGTGISRISDREDALTEEEVYALVKIIESMSGRIREEHFILDNIMEQFRLVSSELETFLRSLVLCWSLLSRLKGI